MSENIALDGKSELRRMAIQLARLVEISVTLNSTLKLDQLLQFILDTAVSILECEAASILLYNDRWQKLNFAASTTSSPEEFADILVPLDGSIAGTVWRENRPIVVNDVEKEPRYFRAVSKRLSFKVKTLLGVPMSIQEQVTGVIEALNKNDGYFTAEDTELLTIIASQAAVAIHNAQLMQALQDANKELSQVDKLKSDFMAVASHELRTPLGIIMGYATFLKEEAQGKLTNHTDLVLNAAIRLQTLVEDMTNMNLLSTGEADLSLESTEIQAILNKAFQKVASAVEAKNDELIVHLSEKPFLVKADPKLELVFLNILNNAIRFTPDPGIISVNMETNRDEVLIEIKDNGIGIPADKLERVFDQFYQVEDHMTRHYGGLGLGLAIARALTELHGGRIWAESEGLGKGTAFYVALPRYQDV
jgi:signal transduction histidine kinase